MSLPNKAMQPPVLRASVDRQNIRRRSDMQSKGVVIRPYQIGDAPLLFEAATESVAEVFRWLPGAILGT